MTWKHLPKTRKEKKAYEHSRDSGAALRLVDKGEAWDTPLDNFVFWCLLWTNGEDYFAHRYPTRKLPEDPSLSELAKLAQLIPRAAYQPEIPPGLTAAPIPPPDGCYVKLACLFGFNPEKSGDTSVAEGVLREARICEKLVNNPHPNICRYYGYIEKDGRIAGLCFEHHDQTLDEYKASGGQLDVDPIVEGVRSGLDHLHGLGIVHVRFLLLFYQILNSTSILERHQPAEYHAR